MQIRFEETLYNSIDNSALEGYPTKEELSNTLGGFTTTDDYRKGVSSLLDRLSKKADASEVSSLSEGVSAIRSDIANKVDKETMGRELAGYTTLQEYEKGVSLKADTANVHKYIKSLQKYIDYLNQRQCGSNIKSISNEGVITALRQMQCPIFTSVLDTEPSDVEIIEFPYKIPLTLKKDTDILENKVAYLLREQKHGVLLTNNYNSAYVDLTTDFDKIVVRKGKGRYYRFIFSVEKLTKAPLGTKWTFYCQESNGATGYVDTPSSSYGYYAFIKSWGDNTSGFSILEGYKYEMIKTWNPLEFYVCRCKME